MQYRAIRNLTKNGNSYTVALPRHFIIALGLMRREELVLTYDDDTEAITVKRAHPRAKPAGGRSTRDVRPVL